MTAGRQSVTLKKDWGTPHKYVESVKNVLGTIHLDPCSNKYSVVNAKVEYLLPHKDGLHETWNYETIYVNPPYGSDKSRKTTIKQWLLKCSEANQHFNSEVLALIPVAPNTLHWKKYVFTCATAICFLYDTRLKFLENGKDVGKGAPMACAMIYWGDNYKKFKSVFKIHGAVVNIENLKPKKGTKKAKNPKTKMAELF